MENVQTNVKLDGETKIDINEVQAQMLMAQTKEGIHAMIYGDRETLYSMVLDTVEHDPDFGMVIGLVCATIINAPEGETPPSILAIKHTVMKTTIELAKESGQFDEAMKYAVEKAKDRDSQ